ncbi:hypothetical protein BKA64DRAFT_708815 [Cadophora sp. MPI-SDFR-AT-0126]|nr:hypothetical protein BKA64DRAFT_708815 [Leotiomycetes sp. MPI-SDFR-AT-0126]
MAASDTYSTATIDGSADEFSPSSTSPPPRTPAQVAADMALSRQRTAAFVADTSLPVVTPAFYHVINSNASQPNPTAARTQAARINIANFNLAFDNNATNANKRRK